MPVAAILSITSELFSSKVRTFNLCICQLRSSAVQHCRDDELVEIIYPSEMLHGRPMLTYICVLFVASVIAYGADS